jgi:hypothetical protein
LLFIRFKLIGNGNVQGPFGKVEVLELVIRVALTKDKRAGGAGYITSAVETVVETINHRTVCAVAHKVYPLIKS